MSAKHPSSDEERQVLADENADIALAVANAMQPRGADGCDEDAEFGFTLDLILHAVARLHAAGWDSGQLA